MASHPMDHWQLDATAWVLAATTAAAVGPYVLLDEDQCGIEEVEKSSAGSARNASRCKHPVPDYRAVLDLDALLPNADGVLCLALDHLRRSSSSSSLLLW
jgi:hypothetical protein